MKVFANLLNKLGQICYSQNDYPLCEHGQVFPNVIISLTFIIPPWNKLSNFGHNILILKGQNRHIYILFTCLLWSKHFASNMKVWPKGDGSMV
jgi:hypothetical protein